MDSDSRRPYNTGGSNGEGPCARRRQRHGAAPGGMGAGAHVAVDGYLVRADPWPAPRLPRGYARRERNRARRGGGHCRGYGANHPRFLGLAVGCARAAQGAHRGGLWPRRRHQAALPARQLHRPRAARPLCRSHRQGDQRRAPRCARRRFDAIRQEGSGLRPSPVARHGRRDARPGGGDRLDVSLQRRHPHGALVRGDPRGAGGGRPHGWREGARARTRQGACPSAGQGDRRARLRLLARHRRRCGVYTCPVQRSLPCHPRNAIKGSLWPGPRRSSR